MTSLKPMSKATRSYRSPKQRQGLDKMPFKNINFQTTTRQTYKSILSQEYVPERYTVTRFHGNTQGV